MTLKTIAAFALMTAGAPAFADDRPEPSIKRLAIPADLAVPVLLDSEVSSKRMRVGDRFNVTVARDVVQDGRVVVPRGTQGSGAVVWRTGRGAFGRSAKMEIAVTALMLDGQTIPMTGRFRENGDGNTSATVGTSWSAG